MGRLFSGRSAASRPLPAEPDVAQCCVVRPADPQDFFDLPVRDRAMSQATAPTNPTRTPDLTNPTPDKSASAATKSVSSEALRPTSDRPATAIDERGETLQGRRYIAEAASTPSLPRMPKIGLPEEAYVRVANEAEQKGDDLTHEAAKAGQYVSLALRDLDAPWPRKLKFFRHALKRHCQPPEHADDLTKAWFAKLATHVKKHAGTEALRLAAEADERYEARLSMGQTTDDIADDAEEFFNMICPHCDTCPPLYNESDWIQLKVFRDRWI